MASATKTKPALWKRIVSSVKSGTKGGRKGQWSARKAQLATARYKKAGGGYKGAKSSSNSLTKWGKQKWDYVSKGDKKKPKKKRGRYYLSQLEKALVLLRKQARIELRKELLQRESKKLNTANQLQRK